jgi:hypothetical protein
MVRSGWPDGGPGTRTKHDFAQQMRDLVDRHFPVATTIRLVLDNLNTHTLAAIYAAFPPAEAGRLRRKLHRLYPSDSAKNLLYVEWHHRCHTEPWRRPERRHPD